MKRQIIIAETFLLFREGERCPDNLLCSQAFGSGISLSYVPGKILHDPFVNELSSRISLMPFNSTAYGWLILVILSASVFDFFSLFLYLLQIINPSCIGTRYSFYFSNNMLIRWWIQERDIVKRLEGLFLANIPSICLLTPHSILVITDTSVSPGSFNLRAGKPWVPLLQCTTLPGAIFSMSVFNDRGGLFSIDRLQSGGVITNYTCTSRCAHCLYGCSPGWPKEYMDRDMLMRVLSSKHEKRPKGIAGLAGL